MDDRLQKALEFSNYTLTLNNQKKNIKNRVAQLQIVHFKGGVFNANPETISFAYAMKNLHSGTDDIIIADTKENPIRISDIDAFIEQLLSAYNSSMVEFDAEYAKLKKARNIKKLMDW